jgi:phosphate transport system substrate-binding protein
MRALAGLAIATLLSTIPMTAISADSVITVRGSLFPVPPMTKIAESYEGEHADVAITVKGTSSGEGVSALKNREIDVAMVDIAVNDPDLVDTMLGSSAFAFVVNPDAGITNLTRAQVRSIYNGKATNWKQLGGNNLPIVPMTREVGTGVRFVFEANVTKTEIKAKVQPDSPSTVAAVRATPGAIGLIAANIFQQNRDIVVAYESVLPTPQHIADGSYAFSTHEHLYTRKDASPAVTAFVAYAQGQSSMLADGGIFQAAPSDVVIRAEGSTIISPILARIAANYHYTKTDVKVAIIGSNSGEGIAALKSGDAEIGLSDVAIDDPNFIDTTLGVTGFAFIVNGAGIKNLSRADVAKIYSGKVTNWKQLGGNDLAIVPLTRPIGVGTRYVFEMSVAKTLIQPKVIPDAPGMVSATAETPGAIGFSTVSAIGSHQDLIVTYEGVEPTTQNISSHLYKFATDEHLYVHKGMPSSISAFVAYAAAQHDLWASGGIYSK